MKSEYTPGPWSYDSNGFVRPVSDIPDMENAAIAELFDVSPNITAKANGPLMAAAPDMLEALIEIVEGRYDKGMEKARAAIAEAEGEKKCEGRMKNPKIEKELAIALEVCVRRLEWHNEYLTAFPLDVAAIDRAKKVLSEVKVENV